MRFIAVLALAMLLAGCTQYALVSPQQRVSVRDAFTVEPDIAWNKINEQGVLGPSRTETWTTDGQLLNSLVFFAGIEDGQPLYRQTAEQEKRDKLPVFRSNMNSTDIMELVEATYAKVIQTTLTKSRALRPAKFADTDGFRFEMSLVGKDEIDREATAIGTVRNGRLYLIFYQGARLHHYGLRQAQAERIIQSAKFQAQ
jgi:hypothetical protein